MNSPSENSSNRKTNQIMSARGNDKDSYSRLEPHRRELQVHCYRMLGSLQDAEDLVQETLLRAWQKLDTYQGRAPLRAWLYKIATNACLDALDRRPRRVLPQNIAPPELMPEHPAPPRTEPIWLEPLPDEWLTAQSDEPEARYSLRESVSLAFLAALQFLPARQRAVLILTDVLDWEPSQVAQLLNITRSAVNSALHRARVTMSKHYRSGEWERLPVETDAATRTILDQYVKAWENADVNELAALLANEARLSMPPTPSWYQGRETIAEMLRLIAFPHAGPGDWQLRPTNANGLPAFGVYQRAPDDVLHALGIQLIEVRAARIAEVTVFMNPALLKHFALPLELRTIQS